MHNLCIKICRRTSFLKICPYMWSKTCPTEVAIKRMLKKCKILILRSNVLTLLPTVFLSQRHHIYFLPIGLLYGLKGSFIPILLLYSKSAYDEELLIECKKSERCFFLRKPLKMRHICKKALAATREISLETREFS